LSKVLSYSTQYLQQDLATSLRPPPPLTCAPPTLTSSNPATTILIMSQILLVTTSRETRAILEPYPTTDVFKIIIIIIIIWGDFDISKKWL
jgi:hypothetical protein